MDSNDLVYELQSGFRPSFSTDSCLIQMSDFIRKQQDKGYYTGMVILDLQKAFDTVNHKILLDKLRAMGVRRIAVQWFKFYLSGREQLVNIADILTRVLGMFHVVYLKAPFWALFYFWYM